MSAKTRILLVDDDTGILWGVGGLLRDEGYDVVEAASARAARKVLNPAEEAPALLILDIGMPEETGLDLLESLPKPLSIPAVILSGEATMSDTLRALELGASDFVEKPPTPERLLTAVRNTLALRAMAEERERLCRELAAPGHLIGDSPAMADLRRVVARVGPSSSIVLITGETGTGKERVARALHLASERRGRFIAVNCAAIPSALLESELFGYERGAFSGAAARRIGRVEQAQGGTLLLDEVGDMPMDLQAKLLRVLEQREVERLGGTEAVPVDVRFLASTHRDLPRLIDEGRFRQDLYYRLNVFPIIIPPLRERYEDVVPLMRAFATDIVGPDVPLRIVPEAVTALRSYAWPGNVRELRNFVERLSLLRPDDRDFVIDATSVVALAGSLPGPRTSPVIADLGAKAYREILDDMERAVLEAALERESGNIAATARLLRTDRGNLYRRMRALGLVSGTASEE